MIPLEDRLWTKLPDAYGKTHVNECVAALINEWDQGDAADLLWSRLCHQDSLYIASFAAAPHLLDFAERAQDPECRQYIAFFLGWMAYCVDLPGNPGPAFHGYEMQPLRSIRDTWAKLLPRIADLSEREALQEPAADTAAQLLIGLAAVTGCRPEAGLLESLEEGVLACRPCDAHFKWTRFDKRIAVYPLSSNGIRCDDSSYRDWEEGAPSRQLCFLRPAGTPGEDRLARAALSHPAQQLARHLCLIRGTLDCPDCGVAGPPA